MHTDEYQISLSRELGVCKNTVKEYRRSLAALEHKYCMTTDAFLTAKQEGGLSVPEKDARAWKEQSEALKQWEERQREFEELYRIMKR